MHFILQALITKVSKNASYSNHKTLAINPAIGAAGEVTKKHFSQRMEKMKPS